MQAITSVQATQHQYRTMQERITAEKTEAARTTEVAAGGHWAAFLTQSGAIDPGATPRRLSILA